MSLKTKYYTKEGIPQSPKCHPEFISGSMVKALEHVSKILKQVQNDTIWGFAKPYAKILLIGFFFTSLQGMAYAQTSPFKQLKQKFEDGRIFHADFVHRYLDSYTQDTVANSGEIWVGKQDYKVKSPTQLVAVNGGVSKVYDSSRNRLIISTYDPQEDDFAPSRILNGIDSTYTIDRQQKQGSEYIINLRSDDPFALFKRVEITLNSDLVPLKIFVEDPSDNQLITTFSKGTFLDKQDGTFQLEYPSDVKIIDMRN